MADTHNNHPGIVTDATAGGYYPDINDGRYESSDEDSDDENTTSATTATDGDTECPACDSTFDSPHERPYHCPDCGQFFPELEGL